MARGKSKHRPRDAEHLYGGSYPFIQTGDIKHADLYVTKFTQTYSEAGLEQSKLWPAGTLCITIAANIADTAILGLDACFPDGVIGFVADDSQCDVRFLKYKFDTIKQQYQQVSQGATQDNLSLEKLLSFKLRVPRPEIQRKIGDILSSYDDLIENNRRRMALLEESARLLYREWFVRLRFPGHEHVRVVDGVPEGWEKKPLEVVAEINQRSLRSSYQGALEYIDIASVTTGRIDSTQNFESIEEAPSRARRAVQHGDIIWSCVRPNRRSYALIFKPSEIAIASTGFAVISSITLPFSYLYFATTTDAFVGYLENNAKGVAYPAVLSKDFERANVLVPTHSIVQNFHDIVEPIFGQRQILEFQNQKLRAARDFLLPKLMSG